MKLKSTANTGASRRKKTVSSRKSPWASCRGVGCQPLIRCVPARVPASTWSGPVRFADSAVRPAAEISTSASRPWMRPGIGSPWPAAAGVHPPILGYEPFRLGQPSSGQRPRGCDRWSPGCRLPVKRPLVSPRTSPRLRPLVSGTVDQAQSLRSSASARHRRHRDRRGVPLGRRYHPDRAPLKARPRGPRPRDAASQPRRTTVGHAARATLAGDAGYRDAGAAPGSFQSTT